MSASHPFEDAVTASTDRPMSLGAGKIRVIGVGTGGLHASTLLSKWPSRPELVGLHANKQVLDALSMDQHILIGQDMTHGLSCGGDPEMGRQAALKQAEELKPLFKGAELVVLVAGLGGGTGTGAMPVLAEYAREAGALTLCFVTLPFDFEGDARKRTAERGLQELLKVADTVVSLPCQRLFELVEDKTSLVSAFKTADYMLSSGIHSIWKLLAGGGIIHVDFADLRNLLRYSGGLATMAFAEAEGPERAQSAVDALLSSPLLERGSLLAQAQGVLVGILGDEGITLLEVQTVMKAVSSLTSLQCQTVMGTAVDAQWQGKLVLSMLCSESAPAGQPSVAPQATAVPESNRTPTHHRKRTSKKKTSALKQSQLSFHQGGKGRFSDVEPTYHSGEELDTPTFIRRGITLRPS